MTSSPINPWLIANVLSVILGLFLLGFWVFIFLQYIAFEGDSGNYSSRNKLLKTSIMFALIGGIIIGIMISGLQLLLMLAYLDSIIKLILINISIFVVLLFILYCLIIFNLKTEE